MTRFFLKASVLAFCSICFLTGCEDKPVKKASKEPLPVQVVTLSETSEKISIIVPGKAEGAREVVVRAETGGTLMETTFTEGARVKAGDVLFRLDDVKQQAAVRTAKAEAEEARVDYKQAQRELARAEKLWRSGSGSRRDYDDRLTEVAAARAALDAKSANLETSRVELNRTVVKAPVGGFAGKAALNPGALVSAYSSELVTITQRDSVQVHFDPPKSALQHYSVTLKNPTSFINEDGEEFPAKLNFVSQKVDPDTGTVSMRALVSGDTGIVPGSVVRMKLMLGTIDKAVRIPQKAIKQDPDGTYTVWLITDGRAQPRKVELGDQLGTDWLALSGVKAGDKLIVNQLLKLRKGAAVVESSGKQNKKKEQ